MSRIHARKRLVPGKFSKKDLERCLSSYEKDLSERNLRAAQSMIANPSNPSSSQSHSRIDAPSSSSESQPESLEASSVIAEEAEQA